MGWKISAPENGQSWKQFFDNAYANYERSLRDYKLPGATTPFYSEDEIASRLANYRSQLEQRYLPKPRVINPEQHHIEVQNRRRAYQRWHMENRSQRQLTRFGNRTVLDENGQWVSTDTDEAIKARKFERYNEGHRNTDSRLDLERRHLENQTKYGAMSKADRQTARETADARRAEIMENERIDRANENEAWKKDHPKKSKFERSIVRKFRRFKAMRLGGKLAIGAAVVAVGTGLYFGLFGGKDDEKVEQTQKAPIKDNQEAQTDSTATGGEAQTDSTKNGGAAPDSVLNDPIKIENIGVEKVDEAEKADEGKKAQDDKKKTEEVKEDNKAAKAEVQEIVDKGQTKDGVKVVGKPAIDGSVELENGDSISADGARFNKDGQRVDLETGKQVDADGNPTTDKTEAKDAGKDKETGKADKKLPDGLRSIELENGDTVTVEKGDCIYNIIKAVLIEAGLNPTEKDIMDEIEAVRKDNNLKWRSKGQVEKWFIDIYPEQKLTINTLKRKKAA